VQEHGFEIGQAFVEAAKRGDWRVSQALMDRIYGKPEAAVVAPVPPNPATEVLKSMASTRSSSSSGECEPENCHSSTGVLVPQVSASL
jgi:hypothetical protein